MKVPLTAGLAAYLLNSTSCAAFGWSLALGMLMPTAVGAFTPVNVQKIPAAHHDALNGAIDTAAVVSVDGDGDGDGERNDANDKEKKATDIDAMIDAMLPEAVALSSSKGADDKDDDDDKDDVPDESSSADAELPAKVSASASAAALREASERRLEAETKRREALENAAAKEEDRQLAALNEQRLAAAAAAAIEEDRKKQAALIEERREAKRRAVEEETARAIKEQSLSQAEKNQRFRREAAAAFGNKEDVLFSPNQQSRREELSRVEANRRADAALPVEVMGASGVASEERRLEEDVPYPPMRPPRPGGYATDDDRSPGFVGFSNARAQYPQKSKWVQQLQAEMLGKPHPMEYGEEAQGYVPPPYADDYPPIDIGARANDGGRSMRTSPAIPPKEEEDKKKKPSGNRVLTPRAPDTSSSPSSASSSTTPTPVNLDRFGDSWFQEQLKASKDEQSGEVHWYEGRRRQMKREEQERQERREAMEAAMERERLERLEREAREEADAEADELEKTEATAAAESTNVEEDSHADKEQERKQRERMAAVLEVDEVRAELEKEREAIRAELEKKRAEASAARAAKLEKERVAQEAAARAVEEQIRAAEEEIAEVEEKVQESAPSVASDAAKDDSTEVDADNDSTIDTDDDDAGEIYNTYKAETIERRLSSLQKDVAKSSEMVEEMSVEVLDLEEEHAHASKMLQRAQDRKNDQLIRIRSDDAAYAKAQLLDMSQELAILKRELACKEELLMIYQKRNDMLKREEWTEGRGPIKSLPLTEWDHREEKEW